MARRAPGVAATEALQAPDPCAEEACWVTAGVARQVDRVLVAGFDNGALKVRVVEHRSSRAMPVVLLTVGLAAAVTGVVLYETGGPTGDAFGVPPSLGQLVEE